MTFEICSLDKAVSGETFVLAPAVQSPIIASIKAPIETPKKVLSLEEENTIDGRIITAYCEGDEQYKTANYKGYIAARNSLTLRNKFLSRTFARKFIGFGLDIEVLDNISQTGIYEATRNYNPEWKFSTHAEDYILKEIREHFYELNSKNFRLPRYLYQLRDKMIIAKSELKEKLNKEPSYKELADYFNERFPPNGTVRKIKPYQVKALETFAREREQLVVNNEDGCTHERIGYESSPLEKIALDENIAKLKEILENGCLKNIEIQILKLHHGIDNNGPYNLKEIGQKTGYTRERIRQIYDSALQKARFFLDKESLALDTLETKVLTSRLGLDYSFPKTLDNISREINYSIEDTTKVFNRALEKAKFGLSVTFDDLSEEERLYIGQTIGLNRKEPMTEKQIRLSMNMKLSEYKRKYISSAKKLRFILHLDTYKGINDLTLSQKDGKNNYLSPKELRSLLSKNTIKKKSYFIKILRKLRIAN